MSLVETFVDPTLESALEDVRRFNGRGLSCSLSYLPIRSSNRADVDSQVNEYLRALDAIHGQGLDADITVKMHQLGVYAGGSLADSATLRIVDTARACGSFVWIDMERPETVDRTLEIHRQASECYGNVGICLQAYLMRTSTDLDPILARGETVRLVKGFYRSHDIARWRDVSRNYRILMLRVLRHSRRPALATHDESLIEEAKQFIWDNEIESAEFQFFKGVREELADQLRKEEFAVRIYLPYGSVLRYWIDGFRTFDLRRQLQRAAGLPPRP